MSGEKHIGGAPDGFRRHAWRNVLLALMVLGGIALTGWLLYTAGIAQVGAAMQAAGWGLALVAAWHVVPLAADTRSWAVLLGPQHRLAFTRLLWTRWVCEAVNTLLPTAQVGGDLVRARLATLSGTPAAVAGASVIADLTLGVLSLGAFALLGLLLLGLRLGEQVAPVATPLLAASLASVVLVGGALLVQRAGPFAALARLASFLGGHDGWSALVQRARELDAALESIYRRPREVAASLAWTLASWILGAGEIWLALHFVGHSVSMSEALILESVVQTVRSVLFLLPGALGAVEGALVLVAGLLGIAPAEAMALALIRRGRELAWGIPGLLLWQAVEGRHAWRLGEPRG